MLEDSPIIAAKAPARVEVEQGKSYHWCRCGRSRSQPFCDGSHRETGLTPLGFTAEKTETVYLCRCKGTGNALFCDGTHKRLVDLDIGSPVSERIRENRAAEAVPTPEEPTVARIHALARKG